MKKLELEILYDKSKIQKKVKELAKQISKDFKNENIVLICVLKGAYLFFSDLVKQIKTNKKIEIDFIQISSYGSETTSSGNVKIIKDITLDVKDKKVIIIEDIIDTGLSANFLINYFLTEKQCSSALICSLLKKPPNIQENHLTTFPVIFPYLIGFHLLEDKFVIGYGLDYDEKYRTLPEIFYFKNPPVK